MTRQTLTALALGIAVQLLVSTIVGYSAGRWGVITYFGVYLISALTGVGTAVCVARLFGIRHIGLRIAVVVLLVLVVSFMSRYMVQFTFTSGFKQRVLQKASVIQWENLLINADQLLSTEGKARTVLPKFVQDVFPERHPHVVVTVNEGSPGSLGLCIWWRDTGVCVGFKIGDHQPSKFRLLCSEALSKKLHLVLFEDN